MSLQLSYSQQEGLEGFLRSNISTEDTIKLAKTVLNLSFKYASEAREALVNKGGSLQNILGRRLVLKTLLQDYATNNNLKPPATATKDQLIDLLGKHWEESSMIVPVNEPPSSSSSREIQQYSQQEEQIVHYSDEDEAQNLAMGFCDVFFSSFHPANFTTDLFFDDCVFSLRINPGNHVEEIHGSSRITSRLYSMVQEDEIILTANPDSVNGMVESHGCLGVLVEGTLHSPGATVGLFQQKCILAQDPHLQGTWRLQNIEIECLMK
eukprot:m.22256 g.22256  ORF g.22256 m.22256 type:complete len:266 (-) comp5442_c0_seq1:1475-2272(-)